VKRRNHEIFAEISRGEKSLPGYLVPFYCFKREQGKPYGLSTCCKHRHRLVLFIWSVQIRRCDVKLQPLTCRCSSVILALQSLARNLRYNADFIPPTAANRRRIRPYAQELGKAIRALYILRPDAYSSERLSVDVPTHRALSLAG
jgi:integrase